MYNMKAATNSILLIPAGWWTQYSCHRDYWSVTKL